MLPRCSALPRAIGWWCSPTATGVITTPSPRTDEIPRSPPRWWRRHGRVEIRTTSCGTCESTRRDRDAIREEGHREGGDSRPNPVPGSGLRLSEGASAGPVMTLVPERGKAAVKRTRWARRSLKSLCRLEKQMGFQVGPLAGHVTWNSCRHQGVTPRWGGPRRSAPNRGLRKCAPGTCGARLGWKTPRNADPDDGYTAIPVFLEQLCGVRFIPNVPHPPCHSCPFGSGAKKSF